MDNPLKACIAALTRGYDQLPAYNKLLRRNRCIEKYLHNKGIPLLLFHEGNIPPEHQAYIRQQTPTLTLQFIMVKGDRAFRADKEPVGREVQEYEGITYPIGYKHMCSFWFVDFWPFVQEYDYVMRIDEDCYIQFPLDPVFEKMRTSITVWIITAMCQDDPDYVTQGLNAFTRAHTGSTTVKDPASGPYTNFIVWKMPPLRNHVGLQSYIRAVDESDNIYRYRWGDLPLWGEAIDYILGKQCLYVDTHLPYYHGSHEQMVNNIVSIGRMNAMFSWNKQQPT
jgi:hypothetical protein